MDKREAMTVKPSKKPKAKSDKARAEELVDFIQDVALGKRKATAKETEDAMAELNKYLPDASEKP